MGKCEKNSVDLTTSAGLGTSSDDEGVNQNKEHLEEEEEDDDSFEAVVPDLDAA